MKIKAKKQRQRETRNKIRQGYRNVVKCSKHPAEGRDHRTMKLLLCNELYEYGVEFQTEVTFYNVGRADIVIEDWSCALEILSTESITRFQQKTYPIITIPLRSSENIMDMIMMLKELHDTNGNAATFYHDRMLGKYSSVAEEQTSK